MKTLEDYPIHELKLIYRLLWTQALTSKTLVTAVFLQDLQDYLLVQATHAGVSVTELTEWSRWLNEDASG
jgi:hypothetical protein